MDEGKKEAYIRQIYAYEVKCPCCGIYNCLQSDDSEQEVGCDECFCVFNAVPDWRESYPIEAN